MRRRLTWQRNTDLVDQAGGVGVRIGVNLGHFAGAPPADLASRLREMDELGFASVWFEEAHGSDAFTPLAFAAALTSRVRVGTAVAQVPARTPAAAAMAAMTLDHLSGGRVVLGWPPIGLAR